MTPAAARLSALLDEEREAARRADLPRLVELQDEKRAAVDALQGAETTEEERAHLALVARENILLLRHLTSLYQALVGGVSEVTYGAQGHRIETGDLKHERGRL